MPTELNRLHEEEMTAKLYANNKRENYERIFPRRGRKIKDEATTNIKLHSHNKRAWENERLPTSF